MAADAGTGTPVTDIRGYLLDLRLAVITDDGNRVVAVTDKDYIRFIIKDLRDPVCSAIAACREMICV